MSTLVVEGLTVSYGRTEAVRRVDLRVPSGQTVCLIGANGAGKTSTLRAIAGLTRPKAGSVRLDNADITGLAANRIARRGLSLVPEGRQVFASLTVAENLTLGGWHAPHEAEARRRRAQVLNRFPRLAERQAQRAGALSGGEQQMLAIGRALMAAPRVLLLDEPSMGLAPRIVEEIFAILAELHAEGVTILLVEQNASAALEVADSAYVLEAGRVALHGPAWRVANDPAVATAYLGG